MDGGGGFVEWTKWNEVGIFWAYSSITEQMFCKNFALSAIFRWITVIPGDITAAS